MKQLHDHIHRRRESTGTAIHNVRNRGKGILVVKTHICHWHDEGRETQSFFTGIKNKERCLLLPLLFIIILEVSNTAIIRKGGKSHVGHRDLFTDDLTICAEHTKTDHKNSRKLSSQQGFGKQSEHAKVNCFHKCQQ